MFSLSYYNMFPRRSEKTREHVVWRESERQEIMNEARVSHMRRSILLLSFCSLSKWVITVVVYVFMPSNSKQRNVNLGSFGGYRDFIRVMFIFRFVTNKLLGREHSL